MITVAMVLARVPGLDEHRLRLWIAEEWVRPAQRAGEPMFEEIDLARVQLILDLDRMEVGVAAMPVVLSLLDQLHEHRRQMRRVVAVLEQQTK
jgi:chaperone modulatory protein CbpM